MELFLFIGSFVLTFLFVTVTLYLLLNRWNYHDSTYKDITGFHYKNINQDKNILAEWRIFRRLEKSFPDSMLLANVHIPYQDGQTNDIDIVLIHSSGVYLIECQTLKGKVYGSDKSKEWVQWITAKNKHQFPNPLPKNKQCTRFLSQYLSLPYEGLTPLIVFGKDTLTVKVKLSSSTKAKVIHVDDIEKTIRSLIKDSSSVLTTKDMKSIYQKLSLFTFISNTHKQ